ncbi:hypothetical protein B0H19DRAFT_1082613 [Mycena capillaripes]|nr:hypothetical protein B0H19DRAFT_1082613 [Mycena capillaripes]
MVACGIVLHFDPALMVQELGEDGGIYINLFLLAIYTLSRRRAPGAKLFIIASCMMAVLGTVQIVITVATTVVVARFVYQAVHGQALHQPESLSALLTLQNFMFLINNESLLGFICCIGGMSLTPSYVALAMVERGPYTAVFKVTAAQITFGLAAATNIVLTALTG